MTGKDIHTQVINLARQNLGESSGYAKKSGPETLRQQRPALTSTPVLEVPMLPKLLISADEVRQLVKYDALTGKFEWLPRGDARFDRRHAGSLAFSTFDKEGYLVGGLKGIQIKAHHVAWIYVTGEWPARGNNIDHINGNRSDNRFSNLRLAKQGENMKNKAVYKNSRSGVHGVWWDARGKCWLVGIGVNGKFKHVGKASSLTEAIAMRRKAEDDYDFHPNHGREAHV